MRFNHDRRSAYRPRLTLAFRASPYASHPHHRIIFAGETVAPSLSEPAEAVLVLERHF
jgi:hypothetical protein